MLGVMDEINDVDLPEGPYMPPDIARFRYADQRGWLDSGWPFELIGKMVPVFPPGTVAHAMYSSRVYRALNAWKNEGPVEL